MSMLEARCPHRALLKRRGLSLSYETVLVALCPWMTPKEFVWKANGMDYR